MAADKCQHGNAPDICQVCIDWRIPAEASYYTMSGLHVRKGQTREEAEAWEAERRLWVGTYGSPEYGGWRRDSFDGRRKPVAEIKGVAL